MAEIDKRIKLHDKTFELYIPEEQIVAAITEVAGEIRKDMEDMNPLFVGILNGAYMFVAELMSKLPPTCELTFAAYSSYHGTKSAGIVQELLPIRSNIKDRPIILLEDIVDTGLTMQCVTKRLRDAGAKDVRVATMLVKPDSLQCDFKPDYAGMEIDNEFIVGFGLDYDGLGRTSRNIYKIVE
ncbi:MAG: hypoxanthine phosphoribosyltransferase [Tannerella sp.]|jgi:hypoxanthine phosphoribosyltransferase|nr:hypoxanthine phosphoribosyltransferase [Tannerella sp.]